jgi:hypothetical protein
MAAASAAAAVIICVATLAGAFSGPSGQPGPSGQSSSPQASDTSSHHATSSVLGTATARPTPRPSAVSPQSLCRQYKDFFTHPERPGNRPAEDAVLKQLSKLAGGELRIIGYCARQLGEGHGYGSRFPGGAGDPGGDPSGHGGFGEPGTSRFDRAGSALPAADARSMSAGPFKAGRTAR